MADLFKEENKKLQILTQKFVNDLTQIWTRIFDRNACIENLDKLAEHAENFYQELVAESMEKEEFIKNEIKELKKEADNLKRLLKVDFVVQTSTHAPLLAVQSQLDNSLAELRECLRQRREEIYELLLEQESLCDELGEPPRPLLADPLPTAEDILEFRKHLDLLKDERVLRLNKLSILRREIKNYLHTLELRVTTETEDRLLNHRQIKLNNETFTGLQRMHDCYGNQVQEVRDQIGSMKSKLKTLWERLETSPRTRHKFEKYTAFTQRSYDVFYGELNRCEALKSQNIKLFVQQIRQEIIQWWDKTLKSEVQRSRFSNFNSHCYTDDLLVLHEMELEDLKMFYDTNKDIFELYADRKMLWERMNALEAKSTEPGRYNNRGGQLLKEEKERRMIATKLPKIEQQIAELVKQYEEREQKSFLVHGENILDVMASEWNKKRLDKEKLSSARKNAQTPAAKLQTTSIRTPMSARNVSTASLRKTPLIVAHQSSMSTTRKRKLNPSEKNTPIAKRSLLYAMNSPSIFLRPTSTAVKTPFKSPLKKTRVVATTIRRKSGGSRRSSLSKKRRSLIKKAQVPGASSSNQEDTYDSFRKCIEPASRSSIKPDTFSMRSNSSSSSNTTRARRMRFNSVENCPRIQEQQQHTPRTPRSMLRSPSPSSCNSRKLTTKNLPIII